MPSKSLSDLSEEMAKIDFCMLQTHTDEGQIAARPMSNNGEVAYRGQSWFFTWDTARMVRDIRRDSRVGLTFHGSAGIMDVVGKPGVMIAIQGTATIFDARATFKEHWTPDIERWFADGIDTDGMVMLRVDADRISYWDGDETGELTP